MKPNTETAKTKVSPTFQSIGASDMNLFMACSRSTDMALRSVKSDIRILIRIQCISSLFVSIEYTHCSWQLLQTNKNKINQV